MLRLEVDPERVDKHLNAAVRRVAQRVNIPGFRKGKAPRAILQNFVGKEYLVEEAMESLVPEAVGDAVKQEDIIPFATPRVNIEQTEPSVSLVATVPLRPTVVLGDYKSIRFDDEPHEVTDEDVENMTMQFRRTQAYSVPVERPAQDNDFVKVDLNVHADEELIWDVEDEEFQLFANEETRGEMALGLSQGIIGMSEGDEKEFSFPVSEESSPDRFVGKTAHVKATLKEIREELVPELDDAMAVTAGVPDVETAEQLTQHVRDQLAQTYERNFNQLIQQKFIDEIIDVSEFKISPIIIEHEGQHLLENYIRQRQLYAGSSAQQFSLNDLSEEEVNEANERAAIDIKQSLIVQELTEAENIEIDDEEANDEIKRVNELATSDEEKFEENDQTRESIKNYLQRQRVIEKMINMVQGIDEETPADPEETEQPKTAQPTPNGD